jgi:transglutaminase-like putative cysteine protease
MESGHRYVLRETFGFMHRYYREQRSDPNKTHVNFGDTGRMKLSGEIIMRVDSPSRPPELMKEAVYSIFIKGSWFGNQSDFEFLSPIEEGSWDLITPAPPDGRKVAMELDLPREKGLLPYPHGGSRLTSDTIFELEQNRDGTVKIIDGAPIVRYELFYHPGLERMEGHPQARNLEIPDNERDTLQKVVDGLGLEHAAPSEKVLALQKFFNSGFSYSLRLLGRGGEETALANFLLRERSGFCEYYATATTLLLRILDIPSRYAIGYAVQEKSILEGKYLVRKRHAHAWAEAYVDEKWEVVDTTPADWLARDAEGASVFEAIRDIFSFVRHKYKVFRIGSGTDYTLSLSIIVVLLTGFLVIRIYRRLKIEAAGRGEEEKTRRLVTVMDSPFTPVLAMLEQSEKGRNKEELLIDWAGRTGIWADFDRDDFAALYLLHLRLRYDPEGISAEERKLLRQGAEKYLRTDTTPLSS